jgi:hypothetical protein
VFRVVPAHRPSCAILGRCRGRGRGNQRLTSAAGGLAWAPVGRGPLVGYNTLICAGETGRSVPRHRAGPAGPGCSLLKDWCQDARALRRLKMGGSRFDYDDASSITGSYTARGSEFPRGIATADPFCGLLVSNRSIFQFSSPRRRGFGPDYSF